MGRTAVLVRARGKRNDHGILCIKVASCRHDQRPRTPLQAIDAATGHAHIIQTRMHAIYRGCETLSTRNCTCFRKNSVRMLLVTTTQCVAAPQIIMTGRHQRSIKHLCTWVMQQAHLPSTAACMATNAQPSAANLARSIHTNIAMRAIEHVPSHPSLAPRTPSTIPVDPAIQAAIAATRAPAQPAAPTQTPQASAAQGAAEATGNGMTAEQMRDAAKAGRGSHPWCCVEHPCATQHAARNTHTLAPQQVHGCFHGSAVKWTALVHCGGMKKYTGVCLCRAWHSCCLPTCPATPRRKRKRQNR